MNNIIGSLESWWAIRFLRACDNRLQVGRGIGIAQEHKKATWSSEADTFVAFTSDLLTARWIIDRLLQRG